MVGWITKLCALCAMSALAQIVLPGAGEREGVRMLCGLLMLKLTCESAAQLIGQMANSADLMQMITCLLR